MDSAQDCSTPRAPYDLDQAVALIAEQFMKCGYGLSDSLRMAACELLQIADTDEAMDMRCN